MKTTDLFDDLQNHNEIVAYPDTFIDFSLGTPNPQTFPTEEIRQALSTIGTSYLGYVHNKGSVELRRSLVRWLNKYSKVQTDIENVLITNGSMEGISLLLQVLSGPDSHIVAENPSYWRAFELFRYFNSNLTLVDVKVGGIDLIALAKELRMIYESKKRVSFLYCIPSYQNPTGEVMSLASRRELLRLASEHDFYIIEDDAKARLGFEPPPPTLFSLCNDNRVILLGTFSKFICPGIRIGWILAPSTVSEKLAAIKPDGGTNPLASEIAAQLIKTVDWEAHFAFLKNFYYSRYQVAETCLSTIDDKFLTWNKPKGGFFVWLILNPSIDLDLFDMYCRESGIVFLRGIRAGAYNKPYGVRLSFGGLSHDEIRLGIARLKEVLQKSYMLR